MATMAAPRLRLFRLPGARTLTAIANQGVAQYQTLWHTAFQDVRQGLNARDLQHALRSSALLATEQQVMDRWSQFVEQPLRQRLPVLMDGTLEAVMTQADLPQPRRVLLRQPQVQQAIADVVGREIVGITQTTLRSVRQVLREGWQQGQTSQTMAYHLKQELGLTPRQRQTLATLKTRLQGQGLRAREVNARLRVARETALTQRARMIARTETITAVNLGAYQTLQALAQQGSLVSASTLRRYWVTTGNACPTCAAIPGMNPGGVPWDQPFQTPDGPAYYPALHPGCNCVTASVYATEG